MQSPTIIFDHTKKTVSVVQLGGPVLDKRAARAATPPKSTIGTSGRPAK